MKELSMELHTDSSRALYEQIYDHIKKEILTRRLRQGEKLPSTRFLSEYLEVSRSTVELAYGQLASEGYVKSEACRGYFVCDVSEIYDLKLSDRALAGNPEKISLKGAGESIEARTAFWQEKYRPKSYPFDFSPSGADLSGFPFKIWSNLTRNLLLDHGRELFLSGNPAGDPLLRQAIADYLHRARGVNCLPEQIVVGAGNEYLQMLLRQILSTHQAVAVESPTYLPAYKTFSNLGFQVSTVSMDEAGISIRQLEETGAAIAYVMPSHQFPTGIVMPMKRRLELLKWAARIPNRYIIEDDYDSEFRYRGKPIPSLQGSDRFGNVIYLGTFSRSIAPATRVSYMVLPVQLLKRYYETCGFYASTVPRIMQSTIYEFIAGGHFERNLNKMRAVYKRRHEFLLEKLKTCSWCQAVRGEHSGLHLLAELPPHCSETELIQQCKEKGVRVYGLSEYCVDKKTEKESGVLILGFGGMEEERIAAGLEKITEIFGNYTRQ